MAPSISTFRARQEKPRAAPALLACSETGWAIAARSRRLSGLPATRFSSSESGLDRKASVSRSRSHALGPRRCAKSCLPTQSACADRRSGRLGRSAGEQLEHRADRALRVFALDEVAGLNQNVAIAGGEEVVLARAGLWKVAVILGSLNQNGRNPDLGELCHLLLELPILGVALDVAPSVPVRVQGDLRPVRILPRSCCFLEFLGREVPIGGPGPPKESTKLSPIGFERSFPPGSGEEPVIPVVPHLGVGHLLTRIIRSVADGQRKQALHALGMERGKNVCCPCAPIVSDQHETLEPKALSQLDHIFPKRDQLP